MKKRLIASIAMFVLALAVFVPAAGFAMGGGTNQIGGVSNSGTKLGDTNLYLEGNTEPVEGVDYTFGSFEEVYESVIILTSGWTIYGVDENTCIQFQCSSSTDSITLSKVGNPLKAVEFQYADINETGNSGKLTMNVPGEATFMYDIWSNYDLDIVGNGTLKLIDGTILSCLLENTSVTNISVKNLYVTRIGEERPISYIGDVCVAAYKGDLNISSQKVVLCVSYAYTLGVCLMAMDGDLTINNNTYIFASGLVGAIAAKGNIKVDLTKNFGNIEQVEYKNRHNVTDTLSVNPVGWTGINCLCCESTSSNELVPAKTVCDPSQVDVSFEAISQGGTGAFYDADTSEQIQSIMVPIGSNYFLESPEDENSSTYKTIRFTLPNNTQKYVDIIPGENSQIGKVTGPVSGYGTISTDESFSVEFLQAGLAVDVLVTTTDGVDTGLRIRGDHYAQNSALAVGESDFTVDFDADSGFYNVSIINPNWEIYGNAPNVNVVYEQYDKYDTMKLADSNNSLTINSYRGDRSRELNLQVNGSASIKKNCTFEGQATLTGDGSLTIEDGCLCAGGAWSNASMANLNLGVKELNVSNNSADVDVAVYADNDLNINSGKVIVSSTNGDEAVAVKGGDAISISDNAEVYASGNLCALAFPNEDFDVSKFRGNENVLDYNGKQKVIEKTTAVEDEEHWFWTLSINDESAANGAYASTVCHKSDNIEAIIDFEANSESGSMGGFYDAEQQPLEGLYVPLNDTITVTDVVPAKEKHIEFGSGFVVCVRADEGFVIDSLDIPADGKVSQDCVISASFRAPEEYTVTFDPANGEEKFEKIVDEGNTVEQPENPVYEGYDFVAWCEDGTEVPFDFNTPITANTELVAKWIVHVDPVDPVDPDDPQSDNPGEEIEAAQTSDSTNVVALVYLAIISAGAVITLRKKNAIER